MEIRNAIEEVNDANCSNAGIFVPTGHLFAQEDLLLQLQRQEARIAELEQSLSQGNTYPVAATNLNSVLERLENLEAKLDDKDDDDDWIDTSKQKFSHKWGGRIMGDLVLFGNDTGAIPDENFFEFRRMRLFVSGSGYGIYDYKLQLDVEPEGNNSVSMKDAYLGIHEIPYLQYVRFGHFKAPFGLEELTSSKYITFMERSLPVVFAPGREVGAAFYRQAADQNGLIAGGVFIHGVSEGRKEDRDDNMGILVAGRATRLLKYDEPSGGRYLLHVGLAGQYVDAGNGNTDDFDSRPELHEGNAFITSSAVQEYTSLGAEIAWVHGPLSLQSEYIYTKTTLPAGTAANLHGVYVYGSYFLTGEHRAYKRSAGAFDRVKPHENFWFMKGCRGSGAWELTARWSHLDYLDDTGQKLSNVTLGTNWYWNPYTRMMFNYIHSYDENGMDTDHDIFAMRLQVDF